MRWRTRPNGDLFTSRRGTPQPPEGYILDAKDPYLAHPKLPECSARFISKEQLSCGKIETIIECSKFGIEVSQLKCHSCDSADQSSHQ